MSRSIETSMSTSENIPEWRRGANPPDYFQPSKWISRRAKLKPRDIQIPIPQPAKAQGTSSSLKRKGSASNISLESLGSDIWYLISVHLRKSDLLCICHASSELHSLIIPILYHTVDLSVHDLPDGITASFTYRRKTCERQSAFVRQILENPEYGRFVRTFKWTMGLEKEKFLTMRLEEDELQYPHDARLVWRSGDIEKLFECLDQVVSLDIELASGYCMGSMMAGYGRSFFPAAQQVRLRGILDVSSIINGTRKTPLSTLQMGPFATTRPDPSRLTEVNKFIYSTVPMISSEYPDLLQPCFLQRCKNLHTLSITLQLDPSRPEISSFYTSLASFLPLIRPHSFIFTLVGQNRQPIPQPRGGICERCGSRQCKSWKMRNARVFAIAMTVISITNIVPEHFRDILLPALAEGWVGLKRVEVKGVLWTLLGELRSEMSARGVQLAGDGWEVDVCPNYAGEILNE